MGVGRVSAETGLTQGVDTELELGFRGGNRVGTSIVVSTEFIHAVIKQQLLTKHLP